MPMDPDTKDFLLHLYDKLWENMGAKEGRLWSYLSVYGAAIALSLGVGEYAGAELYAVMIVLALTVWAMLIVINANWWYQRNRLIVTQIEEKFAAGGALDGVVPRSYRDARFSFDRLYKSSILILAAIGSMLYLKLMWEHRVPGGFLDVEVVISMGLLYSLFLLSTMYCVSQHESYIVSFYNTKRELLAEAGRTPADVEKNVSDGRAKADREYGWNAYGLIFLIFGIAIFDALPGSGNLHWSGRGICGVTLQALIVGIYGAVIRTQGRKKRGWRRTWVVQVVTVAIVLTSASIFLVAPYRLAQSAKTGTPNATNQSSRTNIPIK